VYSYGQRQGSVENDGASVHGPRPSEMRRGLGKQGKASKPFAVTLLCLHQYA